MVSILWRPLCLLIYILKFFRVITFYDFPHYTMSEGVRYIHKFIQAQAQNELDRLRLMARVRYAYKRERRQESSQMEPRSNQTTDEDTIRRRKQAGVPRDFLHINPIADTNRKAAICQAEKERNLECSAEERADLLEKIQQR